MGTFKRTVAAAISGLLIGAASAPAWSADQTTSTVVNGRPALADAGQTSTGVGYRSPLSFLGSAITEAVPHEQPKTCTHSGLYSQHDVVGDPESCFLGRVTIPGGTSAGSVGR